MGVGRVDMAPSPWIFIHGISIVDRGLIVQFFAIFRFFSILPLKESIVLFCGIFCYLLIFVSVASPPSRNFSADTLGHRASISRNILLGCFSYLNPVLILWTLLSNIQFASSLTSSWPCKVNLYAFVVILEFFCLVFFLCLANLPCNRSSCLWGNNVVRF